jgi:hypothetical protein
MERTPKGLYSPEFRAEAVNLVEKSSLSVDRAAKQLSIPKSKDSSGALNLTPGSRPWSRQAADDTLRQLLPRDLARPRIRML